jgi:hypothetical protein
MLLATAVFAQFHNQDELAYIGYTTATGADKDEKIVFEARPRLHFPLREFLDVTERLGDDQQFFWKLDVVFDPHIRMFQDVSVPVRMPSYRVFLAPTLMYVPATDVPDTGRRAAPRNFYALTVEHGHYSNGQEGCAFDAESKDGSDECMAVYANFDQIDLQQDLNRGSGEFSTNFVRAKVKYLRINNYGDEPNGGRYSRTEVTLSGTRLVNRILWADFGGYASDDTKFYPMNQVGLEVAYRFRHKPYPPFSWLPSCMWVDESRVGFEAHYKPSKASAVTPYNVAVFGNSFFRQDALGIGRLGVGFKVEHGQDTYNLRLVDDITRVMVSLVLDLNHVTINRPTRRI